MSDHSKTAALILAKAPKAEGEGEAYDAEAHLHQAMEDFHHAAHSESPNYKSMAAAFRSAFECLEAEEDGEEEGE